MFYGWRAGGKVGRDGGVNERAQRALNVAWRIGLYVLGTREPERVGSDQTRAFEGSSHGGNKEEKG